MPQHNSPGQASLLLSTLHATGEKFSNQASRLYLDDMTLSHQECREGVCLSPSVSTGRGRSLTAPPNHKDIQMLSWKLHQCALHHPFDSLSPSFLSSTNHNANNPHHLLFSLWAQIMKIAYPTFDSCGGRTPLPPPYTTPSSFPFVVAGDAPRSTVTYSRASPLPFPASGYKFTLAPFCADIS